MKMVSFEVSPEPRNMCSLQKEENDHLQMASRKMLSSRDLILVSEFNQNCSLQNCQVMNLCCFKPANLGKHVVITCYIFQELKKEICLHLIGR